LFQILHEFQCDLLIRKINKNSNSNFQIKLTDKSKLDLQNQTKRASSQNIRFLNCTNYKHFS